MAFMELSARLGLDGSAFKAGLDKAKSGVASLRSSLISGAGAMAKSSIAQVVGVAAVIQYARSTLEMGGQISDTAAQLGIGAEELQRWTYAAGLAGAGTGEVASFFEKLTLAKAKAMQGDKAAIASFKALGVSMDNIANKKVEDIARMIGATMATGDISKLLAPLVGVGGKSAGKLIPTFKGDLERTMAAAPVMSSEAVAKLDEAGDAMDKVMLRMRAPMADLLVALMPVVSFFVDSIRLVIASFKEVAIQFSAIGKDMFAMAKLDFSFKNLKELAMQVRADNTPLTQFLKTKGEEMADAEEALKAAQPPPKVAGTAAPTPEPAAAGKAKPEPPMIVPPTIRDSLAQIGGFTMAQNREVLDVQKDQLSTLEKIAENTDKLKDVPEPVDDGL